MHKVQREWEEKKTGAEIGTAGSTLQPGILSLFLVRPYPEPLLMLGHGSLHCYHLPKPALWRGKITWFDSVASNSTL